MIRYLLYSVFFIAAPVFIHADYPEVYKLDNLDIVFRQFTEDINLSYKKSAAAQFDIPLMIASYKRKDENLFQFSSRVNLPYGTVATLNRLNKPSDFLKLDTVLFPNQPAVFIPDNAENDLELFLSSRKYKGEKISINSGSRKTDFYVIRDSRLNSTERSLFLNTYFRFPIDKGKITSFYGSRPHPFTGKLSFHNGIDIAASVGTYVSAAASGTVTETGYDSVLGKYVIITHSGGFYSIYGHLSETLVLLKSSVKTGNIIGKVGNTGYSTGPHLHFEIRKKGESQDPLNYIRGKIR